MEFTDSQKLAINIRNADVLVSAAAGSGKTSVLVERILRRITGIGTDGKVNEPVDIDRLLVMTFTNAAAAEMKERIRKEIEKLPDMGKQSLLVHNAMITTIHGFCRSVITDHFEELSLDPDFRVADENECKLIMQDAVDECMEAAYEKADPGFLRAVECFSKAKNDSGIAELVIPVYRFIIADPDPEGFIRKCCESYNYSDYEEFASSPMMRRFEDMILSRANEAKNAAEAAISLIDEYEDLEPYRPCLEAYTALLESADKLTEESGKHPLECIRTCVQSFEHPRIASIRRNKLDEASIMAAEEVKQLRELAKEKIEDISRMLAFDLESSYDHLMSARSDINALSELVLDFKRIYDTKKRDENIIDFNDMEHMAIRILQNPDIAAQYREQFIEIYVDEYQDSNMTQEMLVRLICRHDPGNVFLVGDVKQSIYRFRQARPDLFLDKFNTYTDAGGPSRRILLNDNFRSRPEVIDSVNEVFSRIMKRRMGGIEYDEDAKLRYGATFYTDEKDDDASDHRTEIVIGASEDLSNAELTADIIAARITGMIRSGFKIYDKKEKHSRPVSFGDFTILVRSIRKFEPVFREVFTGAGIPLAVSGREGYFGTVEVQTALAFLQAVDNPLCDIPLATLARSAVGGFTDRDFAELVIAAGSDLCLYDRIKAVADSADNSGKLYEKCASFTALLNRYKVMSTYTAVYDVLADFIDNEYGDIVRSMSKCEQRMANLAMLLSKAESFGRSSFKGLYQFVRYMDQIQKYEIDDGEAGIVSDNADVVRLMTMHASKGLEFPVCFVAGIEKRRNTKDESGKLVYNSTSGFGINYTDLDRRIITTTIPKMLIREINRVEAIAEEMRLLYVAMTRARDKLILVGCDKEGCFEALSDTLSDTSSGCTSYLDMLKTAYGSSGFECIDISYVTEEDLVTDRLEEDMQRESAADDVLAIVRNFNIGDYDGKDVPLYLSKVGFRYPYPLNPELHAKLSVSELKHKAIEEEMARGMELVPEGQQLFSETEPDKYIPRFMRAEGETERGGTFYGTAFHRIMELWDYSNMHICEDQTRLSITSEEVMEYATLMYSKHRIDKDQLDAIRPDDITAFLTSALGTKMKEASDTGKLFREQPFVIGIPESGETILVQGIIDAFFIEDDGITIVDYKTDHVNDEQMLINRYKAQLEYYGKALSQITGREIKNLIIYSTRLRREIIIQRTDLE